MVRAWPPHLKVRSGRFTIGPAGAGSGDPRVGINVRVDPYTWTVSLGGTAEYYLLQSGGSPSLSLPAAVKLNNVVVAKGSALGSLAAGEWQYGNADTLGFNTVYVRLADDTDPDSKAIGFVRVMRSVDGF